MTTTPMPDPAGGADWTEDDVRLLRETASEQAGKILMTEGAEALATWIEEGSVTFTDASGTERTLLTKYGSAVCALWDEHARSEAETG
jgi:hypothetical protein